MRLKLQQMGMGAEPIMVMAHAGVECEEKPLGGMPASLIPRCQKTAEILLDQEYTNAMEERYGIREEGVF
jgi:hypothetical protein